MTKDLLISPSSGENSIVLGPVLKRLQKLESLTIVNSNIPNIGNQNFGYQESLRKLNLSCNKITQIQEQNFHGLSNLEVLDLSQNQITSIPSAAFQHLPKVMFNLLCS